MLNNVLEVANGANFDAVTNLGGAMEQNHSNAETEIRQSRRNYMSQFLSVLVVVALVLGSCGKDNDGSGKDNDIVGLWKFVNVTLDAVNSQNPKLVEEEKQWVPLWNVFMQGITFEFKSNGSFIFTILGESTSGTYINVVYLSDRAKIMLFYHINKLI